MRFYSVSLIFVWILGYTSGFCEVQSLELGDPPVAGQFTLYGAAPNGGNSGLPVATGDFDGDGFADLVCTPMQASVSATSENRELAGLAYIAFGDGTFGGYVNFATPSAETAVILGATTNDITGNEVWAGDVNGDGVDDLLLCAQGKDGPDGRRRGAGALYILFGHSGFRGRVDLASPPEFVTTIHGAEEGDRLGIWIRAGDLNGDRYEDILIGADGADGPADDRDRAGSAYILFGTETWSASMDLQSPPPGRTVLFHGVDPDDRFGGSLSIADINGDGRQDVLISAALNRAGAFLGDSNASGTGGGDGPPVDLRSQAGESYVFFNPGMWPDEVDAASAPADVSMTVVYGLQFNDFLGEEILGADLNGDGSDELILGGLTATRLGRINSGVGYILEGGKHLENRVIDLASPPSDFRITTIIGARTGDIAGDTILAGDVDSDGIADLLFGSPCNDGPDGNIMQRRGRLDIFFGGPEFFPEVIDLASPPADLRRTFVLGPSAGDTMVYSMTVGDWDRDGFSDPMPNAMRADGWNDQFPETGDAYVISGSLLASLAPTSTPTPTLEPTPTQTRSADFDGNDKVDARDLLYLIQEIRNASP